MSNELQSGSAFFDNVKQDDTHDNKQKHQPSANEDHLDASVSSDSLPQEPSPILAEDAQDVAIHLMRVGSLIVDEHKHLYNQFVAHETSIIDYLSILRIETLHIAQEGLVYIRGQSNDDDVAQGLIQVRTLDLYTTLVVLVLRTYLHERDVAGESRVMIDYDTIEGRLLPFLPLTASDRNDRRRLNGALDKCIKKRFLKKERDSEDAGRYRIMPLLRYEFGVEQASALYDQYAALINNNQQEI